MTDKNVWAFLIHLGSNMWAKKGTTWGRNIHREDFCYKETMFCDKEVWRKVTDFLPSCGINTLVIDSEAAHFDNRLTADNIPHILSNKTEGVDAGVQHLQSLVYKDYFFILKSPSIKFMRKDGSCELSGKDDSLLEFDSYQYDTVR